MHTAIQNMLPSGAREKHLPYYMWLMVPHIYLQKSVSIPLVFCFHISHA